MTEQELNYLTELLVAEGFKVQHKTAPFMTLRKGRDYDALMYQSVLIVHCQRGSEYEKLFESAVHPDAVDDVKKEQIEQLKKALIK